MHLSKRIKICIYLIALVASVLLVPLTFSKYHETYSRSLTLNVQKPTYTVVFHSNTINDTTVSQTFTYGTSQNLRPNSFTNGSATFSNWNTESDGSGTTYNNNQSVINLSIVNNAEIHLYAQWSTSVAEVNGVTYGTIKAAVAAVPANNVQTTIRILTDVAILTADRVNIPNGKNIILDLQGHTVSNAPGSIIPVLENDGYLKITGGTITSDTTQGAVNNTRTLEVENASIIATGTRQAIYNNGGTAYIKNNTVLSSSSVERATVHNLNNGTLYILGGTITSTGFNGVDNVLGTLIIGNNDGTSTTSSPVIQGVYGVNATSTFEFYDGTIKGSAAAVNDINKISDFETGYEITTSHETIGGINYTTMFLSQNVVTVTFDPKGGTVSEPERHVLIGDQIGTLPVPTNAPQVFEGWYTDATNGRKINANEQINADVTYYAHWIPNPVEINGIYYANLTDAFNSIATSAQTTVIVHADISESVTIPANRNILLDLNGYTVSNSATTPVLINKGTLKIINGTIASNGKEGAINNNQNAHLEVDGISVIATGTRQAVYNDKGTAIITGDTFLSATSAERATLQNQPGSTMYLLGGTIKSYNFNGIENGGTMYIGEKDGTIDITSPLIISAKYGINTSGTLKFYDGIIKSVQSTVNGTISEREDNAVDVDMAEVIDNITYNVKYLTIN